MAKISLLDAFEESSKLSTQKAVDLINAKKGASNGFAVLDENGKIPASQVPGGLDEVIEVEITWNEDGSFKQAKRVKDGVIITASDMIKDVLYVNVSEDKHANNLYRWSGTTLVLCPYNPKTEDMTVEFEEIISSQFTSENIGSGETFAEIFKKIYKAISNANYIGWQLSDMGESYSSHITNTNIHIKGVDSAPTQNSENVVTSNGIYNMALDFNNRIAPIEYYIENPTELPFMEESEFISAINTALSEVEI